MSTQPSSPEERLSRLNVSLPRPPDPAGLYCRVLVSGSRCIVSGHGPVRTTRLHDDRAGASHGLVTGQVGGELTLDQGKHAARLTGLAMLSSLRHALGSLDRVKRLVKTFALVNGAPGFDRHPSVVDGFSELMREVFGEGGVAPRSAVGAGSLPFNIPVEVEAEFELWSSHDQHDTGELATSENVYKSRFGLPTVINCIGSLTSLGGSRMDPRVVSRHGYTLLL